MKNKLYLLLSVCFGMFMLAAIPALQPTAPSATYDVDSNNDGADYVPGDNTCATKTGDCTLRAAIMESNASGDSLITLPPGNYRLTLAGTGEDNAATGDLDIKNDITIKGGGMETTIIDANSYDRVFHVFAGHHLTLTRLTIREGYLGTGNQGGGIYTIGGLTLSKVKVYSNTIDGTGASDWGGGIMIFGVGMSRTLVTIENSTIISNSAYEGGGIYAIHNADLTITGTQLISNTAYRGGGTYHVNGAVVTITNSLFYTNSAGLSGGGILNSGDIYLTNVTLSQNSANGGAANGGGIYSTGQANLLNVSVVGNPSGSGVSISSIAGATMILTNTILSDNEPYNCNGLYEELNSGGYNISNDTSCVGRLEEATDIWLPDIQIAPLADNGGRSMTHALLFTSPAVDYVSAGICPSDDQRGYARPIDGDGDGTADCDSGAYERAAALTNYLPVILR